MARILVVEDEEKIARFVELELVHEGYEVDKAADGRAGIEAALEGDYDLVLLDVMLPQLSGLEVLRRLRRSKATPVILLTARDAVMDKVSGLDAGADDYITKPFAIEELLARIRLALRHTPGVAAGTATPGTSAFPGMEASAGTGAEAVNAEPADAPHVLREGPVALDPAAHTVQVDTPEGPQEVALTNREFDVLRTLMERANTVLTREQLLREACGYDFVGETNAIDVYVRHIRAKLDERFGLELVSTVRGVGYVVRRR